MLNKNEIKVGAKAYFEESWTNNIIGGEIIETGMTKVTEHNPVAKPWVKIKIEGSRYEKRDQLAEKCFPTKEAAHKAKSDATEAKMNKYREQIQTVADLVKFMYDNTVSCCEEYTNWEARTVVREKTKELLGIDLES